MDINKLSQKLNSIDESLKDDKSYENLLKNLNTLTTHSQHSFFLNFIKKPLA